MSETGVAVRRERDDDDQQAQQNQPPQDSVRAPVVSYNQASSRNNGAGLTFMRALYLAAVASGENPPPPPARFSATLKERFSDFVVRERNPHPLSLGDPTVRPEYRDPPPPARAVSSGLPSAAKIREALSEMLPAADLDVLIDATAKADVVIREHAEAEAKKKKQQQEEEDSAAAAASSGNTNAGGFLNRNRKYNKKTPGPTLPPVTLPTPFTDKVLRSKVHQALKMSGFSDSRTESDGKICVLLMVENTGRAAQVSQKFSNFSRNPGEFTHVIRPGTCMVERSLWPAGRGEYLHFTLYKENIESGAVLRQLAGKMGIPVKCLQYCGNKDKRAVTTQRVSGRYLSAEACAALNGLNFGRASLVRLGDFEYRREPLQLGRLMGNGFTIALRRVDPPDAATDPAVLRAFEASLQRHGFANYFGPQRFGTTSIPSSAMGEALLRGDYATTLLLVMRSKVEVCPDFAPSLQAYEQGDIAAAVKACPYHCTTERDCLIQLSQNPKDLCRAVLSLPRPLTMLYCHAVQSLIWNKMVALRLERAPRVLVGDIVLAPAQQPAANVSSSGGGAQNDNDGNDESADTAASTAEDVTAAAAEEDQQNTGPLPSVHFVTQQDIAAGRYTLADVLLPIPGPDPELRFPAHDVSGRAAYEKVMSESSSSGGNGDKDSSSSSSSSSISESLLSRTSKFAERHFHIHGAYRNIVVVPANLSLSAKSYSSHDEVIMFTDFERKQQQARRVQQGDDNQEQQQQHQTKKPFHAVVASFELPAGAYATSVLREMCDAQ